MGKLQDLTGQIFGKLTVLKYLGTNKYRRSLYECKCECGNIKIIDSCSLKSGKTRSCGCLKRQTRQDFENLIGKKFGRLTVIKYSYRDKDYHKWWLCKCDCGKECIVSGKSLKSGHTQSCGCLRKELLSNRSKTHNKSQIRPYKIWSLIKQRCYNKKNSRYIYYGERGITMCEEWKNDFVQFYNWAVNNGYKDDLTIDRIDVNGDYCPENCRWVNNNIQRSNTNLRKDNKTGYRCIYKENNKFRVVIKYKKQVIYNNRFDDIETAIKERNKFIIENNLPHNINDFAKTRNDR